MFIFMYVIVAGFHQDRVLVVVQNLLLHDGFDLFGAFLSEALLGDKRFLETLQNQPLHLTIFGCLLPNLHRKIGEKKTF